MVNSIIIPKRVQEIFIGKDGKRCRTNKDFVTFRESFNNDADSKIKILWNENRFQIDILNLFRYNVFATTLKGIHVADGDVFEIRTKLEYGLAAKAITAASVILYACISYSNGEFIFGTFVLYFLVQFEGLMLIFMDLIFNATREKFLNDFLNSRV